MTPFKMQHKEFEPPEELRNAIKCFWYNRRDFGKQQSSFEVLPDGYPEIIFHFGSGCNISYHGASKPLPSPFMVGLLNQPFVLSTKKRFEIIGIRCFPWTVFDLLGLPSNKDGVRVFKHPIARLQSTLERSIREDKIDRALAQIIQFLMDTSPGVTIDSTLYKAGAAMRATNGTMPVSQVAAAAHSTVRTLERKFKQSSGHTVKDVSGLMRFEQVRNRLWLYPDSKLADLAHEIGYTDQSHLSREFKRYSRTTPAAFARKTKVGKKAAGDDFVAFIQA